MVAKINEDSCTGCGNCIDECPAAAISLKEDYIPFVNVNECLDCGVCEDTCPNGAIIID
jgi:NAD-dependent dihydropyrimidine dehydrogenase PreA subunit